MSSDGQDSAMATSDLTNQPIGIEILRGAALEADWGKLSINLAKSFVDGVGVAFGSSGSTGSLIKSLVDAASAIRIADNPKDNAWSLMSLAIGWTFDAIKQSYQLDTDELRNIFREVMDGARENVDNGGVYIRPTFFENPSTNELFRNIREVIIQKKHIIRRLTDENDFDLRARLNAMFNRAVLEISIRKPAIYSSISGAISGIKTSPAQFPLDWMLYHSSLVHDFHGGILFGQEDTKVSISQLYVPLRGLIIIKSDDSKSKNKEDLQNDIVWIHDFLESWISSDTSDNIRLIGGGPGSGKSTTLKALASNFSNIPNMATIFIPLQYVDINKDLKISIEQIIIDKTEGFSGASSLSPEALSGVSRLLFIFDGLDEIAKPGESADNIAQVFVHKLNQLLSNFQFRDSAPIVKAIVSGRLPAFQAVKRYLNAAATVSIEVQGFLPRPTDNSDNQIADIDQRIVWWDKYSSIFKKDRNPPAILRSGTWSSLTHEPLLCYLLALSGYIDTDSTIDELNINSVFENLINQIWFRGWGDRIGSNRLGPGKALTKLDFNQLMETIALAAWLGGDTRIASEENFEHSVKMTKCDDIWQGFMSDNGPDVTNLAMNFYLKSSDQSSRGFEFTHKSFGDYLLARCLARLAFDIVNCGDRRIDYALQEWFRAVSRSIFTAEIISFLKSEMNLRVSSGDISLEGIRETKMFFEKMVGIVDSEGFPLDVSILKGTRSVQHFQKNAEVGLWIIINCCFRTLNDLNDEISPVDIRKYSSKFDLREAVNRLSSPEDWKFNSIGLDFSGIVAPKSDMFGVSANRLNLSYADLQDSNLSWSVMRSWNMSHANLKYCRFLRCLIDQCQFDGANLKYTSFGGAFLSDSNPLYKTKGLIAINAATIALLDPKIRKKISRSASYKKRFVKSDSFGQNEFDKYTLDNMVFYENHIENQLKYIEQRDFDATIVDDDMG